MAERLVLSIFPGLDLLGRSFEEEGYCVVRGPDLLWGGDVRRFHPPPDIWAVANGVPSPLGRAVARAVRQATEV